MQVLTLAQILTLVGELDDSSGDNSARHRFRQFLAEHVHSVGQVRDYVEDCLRTSGDQYNKALQDLVNHTASLLGFEVTYGRYRGVRGEIGFDGLWRWKERFVVAEVKTTDTYAISTAILPNYINELVSDGRIPSQDHALGLYVFGRPDNALRQIGNSIVAERRTNHLRIATIDDLLSLTEMVQESLITTDEAVSLLWPGSVHVTGLVQLLARMASQPDVPVIEEASSGDSADADSEGSASETIGREDDRMHLITPVSDHGEQTAPEIIRRLLGAGWYVFGTRTSGRSDLKPGDRICFYQSTVGVVAECEVTSEAEHRPPSNPGLVHEPDRFPWSFQVQSPRYFFDQPVVIDASLRSRLEAFEGRDPNTSWAWFVQGTRKISAHDFKVLTEVERSTEPY